MEAFDERFVARVLGVKHFYGDDHAGGGIERAENSPLSARGDLVQDTIFSNQFICHELEKRNSQCCLGHLSE